MGIHETKRRCTFPSSLSLLLQCVLLDSKTTMRELVRELVRGVSPERSAGAARTAWGSFLGRGSVRSLQGWSPNAEPDPTTARSPADSAPRHHRRT